MNITDLWSNLICHYKLNDNAASKTIINSKGLSNGTAQQNTSVLHATGKVGGALTFNGTSDYIDTGNTFESVFQATGSNGFTINVWGNFGTPQVSSYIFGVYDKADQENGVETWLQEETGYLICGYLSGGDGGALITSDNPGTNTWTMLTFIVQKLTDTTINLLYYKNGNLIQSGSKTSIMSNFSMPNNLIFGALYHAGIDEFFSGSLDNVMIFNKALSQEEITYLCNNGDGIEIPVPLSGEISIAPALSGEVQIIPSLDGELELAPSLVGEISISYQNQT